MVDYQDKILFIYKKEPHKVFSTNEILKELEPDLFSEIEYEITNTSDLKKIKKAKREKAKLHRKLLYHLNQLIEDGILKVTNKGDKGEKHFVINIKQGEELIIEKKRKKVIKITKPSLPSMPVHSFEEKNIVQRFESISWVDKLNAILIECGLAGNSILKISKQLIGLVNDVLALNEFESLLNFASPESLVNLCKKLELEAIDHRKKINLLLYKISPSLVAFTEIFLKQDFKNISMIFNLNPKDIESQRVELLKILESSYKTSSSIFVRNNDIGSAPYLLGDAGIYTFSENEWMHYTKELRGKLKCIACSQSTLSIDIKKFYDTVSFNIAQFEQLIIKCAESLLGANTVQRTKTSQFFDVMAQINHPFEKETFILGRNYLRFWNYDYVKERFDEKTLFILFKQINEAIRQYALSEETIYASCGMPTRFRIATSFFLQGKHSKEFSLLDYVPFKIKNFEDFYSKDLKKKLKGYELLVDIFSGGVFTEFVRQNDLEVDDILREFNIIMKSYRLPFFAYHFSKKKSTNLRLSEFI